MSVLDVYGMCPDLFVCLCFGCTDQRTLLLNRQRDRDVHHDRKRGKWTRAHTHIPPEKGRNEKRQRRAQKFSIGGMIDSFLIWKEV